MRLVTETLMQARAAILERIKVLDRQVLAAAKRNSAARLFMTAPGVGAITALSVASAFDDAARFRSSSSAGAYLGLTPRRYESGEVSRNGHISKHGNSMTRKHLYEAASTLLTRTTAFSTLKASGLRLAKTCGSRRPVSRSRASSPSLSTPCGRPIPSSVGAGRPHDQQHAILTSPSTERPRRDAWRGSGRPFECGPISHRSDTAWTTSADPPSDANMRRSVRSTAERTLSPARMRQPKTRPLTSAIRELQRGRINSLADAAGGI